MSEHDPVPPPTPEAALVARARERLHAGDRRGAALALHRRAALAHRNGDSPVPDLAAAARLLVGLDAEQALVLHDLGHALAQRDAWEHAALVLRECERLARAQGDIELAAAARHTLGRVALASGDYAAARDHLLEAGRALAEGLEAELAAALSGELPEPRPSPVDAELAALKRDMGLE